MKKLIVITCVTLCCYAPVALSQNVGIGTSTPIGGLHIVSDNGLIVEGITGNGSLLNVSAPGNKFIIYSRKGAVRAGYLDGAFINYYTDPEIGFYSVGFGSNVRASGTNSVAIGASALAAQVGDLALGLNAQATGQYSIAISGTGSKASGGNSLSIGNAAFARAYGTVGIGNSINAGHGPGEGQYAFAIGNGNTSEFQSGGHYATGDYSFSIGNTSVSVGNHAFAIGNDNASGGDILSPNQGRYGFSIGNSCLASGIYSFAIGNNASTNGHQGSMVLGSRIDGIKVNSPGDFHFLAQFAGGYQLQSNDAGSLGVFLQPNSSSWGSLCDSTKKEQILDMDDNDVLKKLASIDYYSWKYKDDPDFNNRHYGIMAQDFYAAFGQDGLGTIGCDTLVNPIDLLGVAYSAIKALDKKIEKLDDLVKENQLLKARLEKLEAIIFKKE